MQSRELFRAELDRLRHEVLLQKLLMLHNRPLQRHPDHAFVQKLLFQLGVLRQMVVGKNDFSGHVGQRIRARPQLRPLAVAHRTGQSEAVERDRVHACETPLLALPRRHGKFLKPLPTLPLLFQPPRWCRRFPVEKFLKNCAVGKCGGNRFLLSQC